MQTPVIVRFSTVIHERGSPETLRDPRGFAVKFYTREGNTDMVGKHWLIALISASGVGVCSMLPFVFVGLIAVIPAIFISLYELSVLLHVHA